MTIFLLLPRDVFQYFHISVYKHQFTCDRHTFSLHSFQASDDPPGADSLLQKTRYLSNKTNRPENIDRESHMVSLTASVFLLLLFDSLFYIYKDHK